MAELKPETDPLPPVSAATEAAHLRDLSPQQWKSGIAAWLGWLFDGLDMHIYVLVAAPFVTELLGAASPKDPTVGFYSSWIQAAFLIGWALGGGFFGRVSDRIGRSRALTLTILTYALATGLSYFATTWWQLLVFRFLAALGIGGEWAVGASLLSETWPRRWRPWIAAVLQTAVNLGVMLAALAVFLMADLPPRCVFLIGVLPAFLVLWIRRAVPEPEEWHAAKLHTSARDEPRFLDLFLAPIRRTTLLTLSICACALTAHWAFLFWFSQQLRNLPELNDWSDGDKSRLVGVTMLVLVAVSIVGNFAAAWLARRLTYRSAIAILCLVYWASMAWTYAVPRGRDELWVGYVVVGLCQGVFGLFTMYLPPLFPTLLRTTGAGFCYNFGRIMAGLGTVVFGLYAGRLGLITTPGDYRLALFAASFLFLPAALIAYFMPLTPDERGKHVALETETEGKQSQLIQSK